MEHEDRAAEAAASRLDAAIASVCSHIEALAPGCKAGVCIASPDRSMLERSIFPSLPESFEATIKELPMHPPYIGCCTAAMDGDRVITVHDLTVESRFSEGFVQLCLSHGIKSLQSRPIHGRGEQPIGTVVMAYGESSDDQRFDAPIMEFAADAVGTLLQEGLDPAPSADPLEGANQSRPDAKD